MTESTAPQRSDQFGITALWRPRGDSPESLTMRWIALTERLAALGPVWRTWFSIERSPLEISIENREKVLEDISSGIHTGQDGRPDPSLGYFWSASNDPEGNWSPRHISMWANAGYRCSMFFDTVHLETDPYHEADPALLDYEIFKSALLAIAESFDSDEAFAFPLRILDHWPANLEGSPRLRPAWMTYVAPRFAPLVSPPQIALVEKRSDGSLFMAATRVRFSTVDPDHLRIANEIAASAPTLTSVVPESGKFGQADVASA